MYVLNKERSTNEANYVRVLRAVEMKDMLNRIIKLLLPSARQTTWEWSGIVTESTASGSYCLNSGPWSWFPGVPAVCPGANWKLTHSFHVSKVEIETLFWELKQKFKVKHSKLCVSPVACYEGLFMWSVMKNTFLLKCHVFCGDVSSVSSVRFWASTMILNITFLGDSVYKMSLSNSTAKMNGSYVK